MARKPRVVKKTGEPERVTFDYLKSPRFRSIRADGAIGGITPEGQIHFALYSERFAIPRQAVHPINADGSVGDAIPELTVSRGSIVREMDVDIFVSPDVARRIQKWLGQQLEKLEKIKKKAAKTPTAKKRPVRRRPSTRKET